MGKGWARGGQGVVKRCSRDGQGVGKGRARGGQGVGKGREKFSSTFYMLLVGEKHCKTKQCGASDMRYPYLRYPDLR